VKVVRTCLALSCVQKRVPRTCQQPTLPCKPPLTPPPGRRQRSLGPAAATFAGSDYTKASAPTIAARGNSEGSTECLTSMPPGPFLGRFPPQASLPTRFGKVVTRGEGAPSVSPHLPAHAPPPPPPPPPPPGAAGASACRRRGTELIRAIAQRPWRLWHEIHRYGRQPALERSVCRASVRLPPRPRRERVGTRRLSLRQHKTLLQVVVLPGRVL